MSQRGVTSLTELDIIYICTTERKFIILQDRNGTTYYHFPHYTEKMTNLVDESNYSRVQAEENKEQQTPNTDWQGDRLADLLILKMGHCILSSNLGILMTAELREC